MNEIKSAKENIKLICIAFISSFILLFFAGKFYFDKLPNKTNIIELKGVLKNDIKIEKGRRGSRTLIIKLKEYPTIEFTIGSVSLRQTYEQQLLEENTIGDSLTLFVKNKTYRTKILKTEKIPFPENYLHPENVSIVEIKNKKFTYLSIDDYDKEHKINNYLAIALFGFFGVFMTFLGIKGIIYHRKNFE
ncbi:hypothetical protein [Elizabethkingia sp. JS20170427COW]|uniref:hypothetical protein n=1 Tax=Elizabethkingia sp. JS20170427COW TaxID=2583851 RepID=UPI001110FB35|nr:hypothetical protein [Elizabethkingia sp. JS20170427COW]QCX54375.1 hypothetical protein FGE20_11805 [Elizabethkingia sp. JS20170427COW]